MAPTPAVSPQRRTAGYATALAILMGMLGHFEGTRYTAYRDIAGVLTICTGETHSVHEGQTATVEQCHDMTMREAARSLWEVDGMLKDHPPPHRWAGLADFEYNVGAGRFQAIANRINSGDLQGGCNALLLYDKVRVNGVLRVNSWQQKRRTAERTLCLQGD